MRDEIIFTKFTGADFSELVALAKSTYPGHEISDERYLFWEYYNNPDGNVIMNIAESKGDAVAQYAVLPRRYSLNGKNISGSLSVNTLTHPLFRGRNLFPQLAKSTFEQCNKCQILFTAGFPNPVSLPVIKKKKIFDVPGSLRLLFLPVNPFSSLIKYLKGKKEKRGAEIPLTMPTFKNSNVSVFNTSDAGYNQLLKTFNEERQLTGYRSAEFLNWRYFTIPRRTYHAIKYTDEGLKAIVIFRAKYIFGIRCLVIVDMISNDQNALQVLLETTKQVAIANEVELLLSAVTGHSEEYSTLKTAGFYSIPDFILPQKLSFIVRKNHPDCPDDILNFEKWYLTFGDYDIF